MTLPFTHHPNCNPDPTEDPYHGCECGAVGGTPHGPFRPEQALSRSTSMAPNPLLPPEPPAEPEHTDALEHQGVELVSDDPAPDLQYSPDHPVVEHLEDKAKERMAFPPDGLGDMDNQTAFQIGYNTAVHDAREYFSNPGLSVELIEVTFDPTIRTDHIYEEQPADDSLRRVMDAATLEDPSATDPS